MHAHSESQSVALFGKRVLADVISEIKMRPYWIWVSYCIWVDPKPNMTGAFIRTEDAETYRHGGKGPRKGGGRDRSGVATSHGLPRLVCSQQKPEEARNGPPLELSEGAPFCQHLNFRLLASRTAGEYISVV